MSFKKHIAEILKEYNDLYIYNDTTNGVVVIFKFPEVEYISKLYNLVSNNILSSYDVDDIVADESWVYSYGDKTSLDMAKAALSNFIFILSTDTGANGLIYKFNIAGHYYSTLKDVMIGVVANSGIDTYTNIKNYDIVTLYYTATLALGKQQISIPEFIERISGDKVETREQVTRAVPQSSKHTSQDLSKMDLSRPTPMRNPLGEGEQNFRQAKSADEARKMPEYQEIFALLDKMSDGTITEREKARLNPKYAIGPGGGGEIVDGKIITDEDYRPHKGKIRVKKKR